MRECVAFPAGCAGDGLRRRWMPAVGLRDRLDLRSDVFVNVLLALTSSPLCSIARSIRVPLWCARVCLCGVCVCVCVCVRIRRSPSHCSRNWITRNCRRPFSLPALSPGPLRPPSVARSLTAPHGPRRKVHVDVDAVAVRVPSHRAYHKAYAYN